MQQDHGMSKTYRDCISCAHSNSQQDANSYKKFEQTHLDIQKDVDDCLLVLVVLDECCNSFHDLLL